MEVGFDIENIEVLNANGSLDVSVTFRISADDFGESSLSVRVEDASSLDNAVEAAREKVRRYADGLGAAAQRSFFQS